MFDTADIVRDGDVTSIEPLISTSLLLSEAGAHYGPQDRVEQPTLVRNEGYSPSQLL